MSTTPLYSPKYRELDSNGYPLAGGKLYSYAAGTSTPLATYTTRAGDVPNANPVILDANGEADVWGTPGVLYKLALYDSNDVPQWTVDNIPWPADSLAGSGGATSGADTLEPGGRLTFASNTAVPVTDVVGSGTVFYTPYKHGQVPIWDGSKWVLFTMTAELSQAAGDTTKSPAAVGANETFDVFVWNDNGTLRLSRGPAWSSSSARGTGAGTTELVRIDARLVNKWAISNGPSGGGGLYVGTVYANGASLFEDSVTSRHLWNAYNRVPRPMSVTDATATWGYNSATVRQANGNSANQLAFIVGDRIEPVSAEVFARANQAAVSVFDISIGFGINSTSAMSGFQAKSTASAGVFSLRAPYLAQPALGRTVLAWLEQTDPAYLTIFESNGIHAGIIGTVWG